MTRPTLAAVVGACVAFTLSAPARAELTAFWQHNPITPEAVADDPALATMQSWSVMITHDDGYWTSAGARLTLPAGLHFYRNPLGGDVRPSLSAIAQHPALAFHTYATSPHQIGPTRSPSILAPFPVDQPPASLGGPSDALPGTFSAAWGHPEAVVYPTPVGTYEILRATFPVGASPSVHPLSQTSTIGPDQSALIPSIPEPACMTPLVAGTVLGLLRRSHPSRAPGCAGLTRSPAGRDT